MDTDSIAPPMDALPVHEEEVYEMNIAGIGSGAGPSAAQLQSIRIPPDSPPALYSPGTVTPRRGANLGPNVGPLEVEVCEVCSERADGLTTKITS
jgi:hypothetical protein